MHQEVQIVEWEWQTKIYLWTARAALSGERFGKNSVKYNKKDLKCLYVCLKYIPLYWLASRGASIKLFFFIFFLFFVFLGTISKKVTNLFPCVPQQFKVKRISDILVLLSFPFFMHGLS